MTPILKIDGSARHETSLSRTLSDGLATELLENKRACLVFTSGGTTIGSEMDLASPYLMRIMDFIGMHDVTVIATDRVMVQADEASAAARERIAGIVATARSA